MNRTKAIISCAMLLAGMATTSVNAITISVDVNGSALSGMNYLNFDGALPSYPVVTLTPDAQQVNGSAAEYAAPYVSGNNNLNFGSLYTGSDNTKYLTSGRSPNPGGLITFTFGSDQNYFGLLWGSIDDYNTLTFLNNGQIVRAVTGTDVFTNPDGNQKSGGSAYVNITGITFDKVTAVSNPHYAFEMDNVAYGTVPDGGMTLALLGFAVAGLAAFRRRK